VMSGNRDLPDKSDVSMSPDCDPDGADRSPRLFRLQLSVSPSPPVTPSPPARRVRVPTRGASRARSASPTSRPSHTGLRRHLSDATRLLARLRSFIGEDLDSTSDAVDFLFPGSSVLQYAPRLSLPPQIALLEPHPRDTWANLAEMERFLGNRKCRAPSLISRPPSTRPFLYCLF
jgi:hypothetical protein